MVFSDYADQDNLLLRTTITSNIRVESLLSVQSVLEGINWALTEIPIRLENMLTGGHVTQVNRDDVFTKTNDEKQPSDQVRIEKTRKNKIEKKDGQKPNHNHEKEIKMKLYQEKHFNGKKSPREESNRL